MNNKSLVKLSNIVKNLYKIDYNKEFKNDKTRYIILIVWEILCLFGVAYIQHYLRPQKLQLSPLGYFLQGTLPSFFGAAAYCALFFVFHKTYKSAKNEYKLINSVTFAFTVTFVGLTLWEFMRIVISPFDLYDIVMTFWGCVISAILIFILYYNELKQQRKKHCR